MNFEKVLRGAAYSRLMGGIIFDQHRRPIPKDQLKAVEASILEGNGQKTYYHLNEETSDLTRFDLFGSNTYHHSSKRRLSICDLHHMQLSYEVATGFDIRLTQTRFPMFGNEPLT